MHRYSNPMPRSPPPPTFPYASDSDWSNGAHFHSTSHLFRPHPAPNWSRHKQIVRSKPNYVPRYMLEAPQRSGQHSGVGELFVVLGPLVVLPLLSSLALSSFTTMFVSRAIAPKHANARTSSLTFGLTNASSVIHNETSDAYSPSSHHLYDGSTYDSDALTGLSYDSTSKANEPIVSNATLTRRKRHAHLAKQLGLSTSHHSFVPSTRPKVRRRSAHVSTSLPSLSRTSARKVKVTQLKKQSKHRHQPSLKSEESVEMPLRLNYVGPYGSSSLPSHKRSQIMSSTVSSVAVQSKLFDTLSATRFAAGDALLPFKRKQIDKSFAPNSSSSPPFLSTHSFAPSASANVSTLEQIKRTALISTLLANLHPQSVRSNRNESQKPLLDPFQTPHFESQLTGRSLSSDNPDANPFVHSTPMLDQVSFLVSL
jgi:hypothetical protein